MVMMESYDHDVAKRKSSDDHVMEKIRKNEF